MFQLVVCAAALAWSPWQAEPPSSKADPPPPPESFAGDVDPATLPARPEPEGVDDAESRVVLPLLTTDRTVDKTKLFIDGWLAQSFTLNRFHPPTKWNGPVGFTDRSNEYQLNQLYLRMGREFDPTRDRIDAGFQSDALYGTDAEFVQALGLDDRIILDSRFHRMALPQIFGSLFLPIGSGLTLRAGKFYTPFGLESPPPWGSSVPTKAYSTVYSPFTLTGATATQSFGDCVSATGGVVRGWDQWDDVNNSVSAIGMISLRSANRWTKVTLGGIVGPENDETTNPPQPDANRFLLCGTFEQRFCNKWKVSTQGSWGMQEDAAFGADAHWYGVLQAITFEPNDCFTFVCRGEWFRDEDGFRVTPARRSQPQPWVGTPADYFTLSLGAQIRLNLWMTLRPELRFDWQERASPAAPRAFDDGARSNQVLAVVDAIVRF